MNEQRYVPLKLWARMKRINIGIARAWAKGGLLKGSREPTIGTWAVPLKTKIPEEEVLLERAEQLYREKHNQAILNHQEDPTIRQRWSKEQIMTLCQWPYPDAWRTLRKCLETKIGLIMLRPGAGNPWLGETVRVWTFATCPEDREWGIVSTIASQLGAMKRTADVTSLSITPPDECHALDDDSKGRIDIALEERDTKLDDILRSLRQVKATLLTRELHTLLDGRE